MLTQMDRIIAETRKGPRRSKLKLREAQHAFDAEGGKEPFPSGLRARRGRTAPRRPRAGRIEAEAQR